jgi:glycerol-3-phosphate dehydrogenase
LSEAVARANRDVTLAELERSTWDVLVIGGGSTGVATLLEATERGLKAALIERDDIASETSSRSSKLIHGGLRYLERFQFRLVRQALRERSRFLRDVPHLVHMEPFLVPIQGSPLSVPYIGAGLALYDLLGAARDAGGTMFLTPSMVLRHAPAVRRSHLQGGFIYHDAVMDDARLALALLRTAIRSGGKAVTRANAVAFADTISGPAVVTVCDQETGRALEVAARTVVDCTGPSGDLGMDGTPKMLKPSRGAHVVLEQSTIPSQVGMTLRVPGRVVFVVPWHDCWIVGTTDQLHDGETHRPTATDEEVDYLLDTLRRALDVTVRRSDVVSTFAGIRPLVAQDGATSVQTSREHRIDRASRSLVRIRGGKYTTARVMARDAVDVIAGRVRGGDRDRPIAGALPAAERASFVTRLASQYGLGVTIVDSLADRHGRDSEAVLKLGRQMNLMAPIGNDVPVLEAEVPWAAREELAYSVDDFLARRTRLALLRRDHGAPFGRRVSELLAPELGWSPDETARSAAAYASSSLREYGLPAADVRS